MRQLRVRMARRTTTRLNRPSINGGLTRSTVMSFKNARSRTLRVPVRHAPPPTRQPESNFSKAEAPAPPVPHKVQPMAPTVIRNALSTMKVRSTRLVRSVLTLTSHRVSASTIDARNYLAGPAGVLATGPPLATVPQPWPEMLKHCFAISIRPLRYAGLRARMGSWADHVQLWPGTNGENIRLADWKSRGILMHGSTMKRGETGCYDSHVRLWRHIVDQNLEMALIMEDDFAIRETVEMAMRLKSCFDQVKQLKEPWEMLYLGRGRELQDKTYTPNLVRPKSWGGLFAYVLTLEGAKKLLQHASPYRIPVDVFVGNLHDGRIIRAIAFNPRLAYVVPVFSDTANLK